MAKQQSLDIYKSLLGELNSGHFKPVYFLCGDETFFPDRLQEKFVELIPEASRDFNLDILYGQDTSLDQVLAISRSFPLMADKRMVIVREFFQLFDARQEDEKNNNARKAGPDDLLAYIENPNSTTMLILIDNKSPSGNTRLGKALKKNDAAGFHQFDFIPEHKLPAWISEWMSHNHKGRIEPDASQLLATHLGSNLQQLTVEIGKLAMYKKPGEFITRQDVSSVVRLSREYTVFELQDAITARQRDKALFIADQILRLSDSVPGEVIKLIAFLYSMFSNVWQIQKLRSKRLSDKQIMKETGIGSPFYFKKLSNTAQAYRYQETLEVFETLLDADKAVKGFSNLDHEAVLLMTIRKIVG